HDDAAQIAQADLTHDLFHRFGIGFDDGVFQAVRSTDVLAGVDVNRHQRLSLIDDDVPAGFQPHLGPQRFFKLGRDVERIENRRGTRVQFDATHQTWLKALYETQYALV